MRKTALLLGALALVAVLVIGLMDAGDKDQASPGSGPPDTSGPLTRAAVSRPIPGAPADLAALHRRVNELVGGGPRAFDAQLRALRGHPIVVNLWASWCGPCRAEMPFFQRQVRERGDEVAFLGINVADNRSAAKSFAAEFPMPFPSFEDPRDKIAARYRLAGLPATIFYDTKGKVVLIHQGQFADERGLADAISRYARS